VIKELSTALQEEIPMKKFIILMGCVLLLLTILSCETEAVITDNDLVGEWMFDNGWIVDFITTEKGKIDTVDVYWPSVGSDEMALCDVTLSKNILSGTYAYQSSSGEMDEKDDRVISIMLTIENGKLELKFTGEGPINGWHFKGGEQILEAIPMP
jgi:hypothetical protein